MYPSDLFVFFLLPKTFVECLLWIPVIKMIKIWPKHKVRLFLNIVTFREQILTAVVWANNDNLAAIWMNRVQNQSSIVSYNTSSNPATSATVRKTTQNDTFSSRKYLWIQDPKLGNLWATINIIVTIPLHFHSLEISFHHQ